MSDSGVIIVMLEVGLNQSQVSRRGEGAKYVKS